MITFEEIKEVFSREKSSDLDEIKKIFRQPYSPQKARKLWTGKTK
jgi:hypothetical protein